MIYKKSGPPGESGAAQTDNDGTIFELHVPAGFRKSRGTLHASFLERKRVVSAVRERLPNRRPSQNFAFRANGLHYTATVSRFPDGRIGELFLNNTRSNSASDTNAHDSAIAFSFALQCAADPEAIRRALSRDGQGRATGPLSRALDLILTDDGAGT
jgi:hypothetical protein